MQCKRCKKSGHYAADCQQLFFSSKSEDYKGEELKRMKCLVCLKKGHLNCDKNKIFHKDSLYTDEVRIEVIEIL